MIWPLVFAAKLKVTPEAPGHSHPSHTEHGRDLQEIPGEAGGDRFFISPQRA